MVLRMTEKMKALWSLFFELGKAPVAKIAAYIMEKKINMKEWTISRFSPENHSQLHKL